MRAELLPAGARLESYPWEDPLGLERAAARYGKRFLSDIPRGTEEPLPERLRLARWRLHPAEIERYRRLGADAASAARQALHECHPERSEWEVAGAAARALWSRGIHPLLTLVGGERRGLAYRHPVASGEKIGLRATLVLCGRRHGLFASLTRHVFFRAPTAEERGFALAVAEVEATAFRATAEGLPLAGIFGRIRDMYRKVGFGGQEELHHQGGPTGYAGRDYLATPDETRTVQPNQAFAWNPSITGTKCEDTIIALKNGPLVISLAGDWPTITHRVEGTVLQRPDILVK